jgi:flagellar M-ring protein FliF
VDENEIRSHVAMAAGISATDSQNMTAEEYLAGKISVLSMPFYTEPVVELPIVDNAQSVIQLFNLPIPMWVIYAAAAGLLLFVILLIVLLRIRGKRRKLKKLAKESQEQDAAIQDILSAVEAAVPEQPQGADVMDLQTEKSMELRKSIRRFADDNPELAAQMIKAWLRGGNEDG